MIRGEYPAPKMLRELERDELTPAILFRSSRRQCDVDVEQIGRQNNLEQSAERRGAILNVLEKTYLKYGLEREIVEKHPQYETLLEYGVGAHHAGQLLVWRLVLEEVMSAGLLRMMIATGTVAAGVDFPARTAIVTAHSKRGAEGFKTLTSSEFQQMSGRAGRRGKDAVGVCAIAPSQFSDARVLHEVADRPPEPLRSAYFAAPSTVLNLLKFRNSDDLRLLVSKSLASYLDSQRALLMRVEAEVVQESLQQKNLDEKRLKREEKRVRKMLRDAEELESEQLRLLEISLKGLEALGHVERGVLTEKGSWAAELCTNLVLELAEAIDTHLITQLDEIRLLGVIASIAGESHRAYFSLRKNPVEKKYYEEMTKLVERVASNYQGSPFATEVHVLPDAAVTVISWAEANSWEEYSSYLRLAGVADGDVSRIISQTADHLHQLTRLTESHPELARTAENARALLMRPPITDGYNLVEEVKG